jgi:hypothetical protein
MMLRRFDLVYELYSRAQDLSGPIRLRTYPGDDPRDNEELDYTPENLVSFEWPVAEPLERVALTWEQAETGAPYGDSYLVEDADELAEFHEARTEFLAGSLGGTFYNMMVTRPKGSDERYFLYFRDAIPLEDEHGLIFPR